MQKFPRWYSFEGIEGSQRTVKARPCERPGEEVTGGSAASAEVDTPRMKGLWREDEAWYHVVGSESLKST